MPVKAYGPGEDPELHRWDGGLTWISHPEERMRRASHVVVEDGDAWVVEPVDADGLDDLLAGCGTVAGVVVLSDYHRRDAAAVADRHGVPVYLPEWLSDLAADVDAPTEVFRGVLPGTDLHRVRLFDGPLWREVALYDRETGTLLATESLATADALTRAGERLAVSPYVRLFPPRDALAPLDVRRVLVGHGEPVLSDADAALEAALANARRGAPAVLVRKAPYLLRAAFVALRD